MNIQWPEDNFERECREADGRLKKLNGYSADKTLSADDFYCYMPMPNSFIFHSHAGDLAGN